MKYLLTISLLASAFAYVGGYVPQLPSVGFGTTELVAHEAGLRNLRPLGLGVELLLGVEAFKKLRLQIDFREGHIYLLD